MLPDPQPTASEHIPHKHQAWLDDNSQLAGVPALKKMKSVEKNIAKKKITCKKQDPKRPHPLKYQPMAQMLQRTPMQQL